MTRRGIGAWAPWTAGRLTTPLTVLLAALFCGPSVVGAQFVAPPALGAGAALPVAFRTRISADPTAFTLPNGLFRVDGEGRPMPAPTVGTKGMLVVPALFSDSPEPHVTSADIQRLVFDGPAARGTLTEAYLEMSRGLFRVSGRVLPWVRTSLTRAQVVGASAGLGEDARVGAYLLEALAAVDSMVDFGAYDNDGPDGVPNSGDDNGYVDAIAFEFIEVAGSCGGAGIWPHLWGISAQNEGGPFRSQDRTPAGAPVKVDAYIVQSAVDCGGVNPMDAATISHEFGHVLGLPDYYHPTAAGGAEGRRWVLGCWELMAAGSWGCGPVLPSREPFGPTHMSAISKNALGGWTSRASGRSGIRRWSSTPCSARAGPFASPWTTPEGSPSWWSTGPARGSTRSSPPKGCWSTTTTGRAPSVRARRRARRTSCPSWSRTTTEAWSATASRAATGVRPGTPGVWAEASGSSTSAPGPRSS